MAPTRTEPAPADAASARERIALAAARAFAARGYDGARIDAIARDARVNKALLYYYFAGKQELYRALVLEHLEYVAGRLAGALDPARPARVDLERCIAVLATVMEERPHLPRFLMREILAGWEHLRDEDFAMLPRLAGPIASTVGRGMASGELRRVPPLLVHFLVVASMSVFFISREARERGSRLVGEPSLVPEPAAFARFLSSTLLSGLAQDAPSGPPRSTGEPA